jgi:hypothetical protein
MPLALLAYEFGTLLAIAAVVAWAIAWVVGAISVLRRGDLGVGGKIVWLVIFLVIPIFGLLVYYLWDAMRPSTR